METHHYFTFICMMRYFEPEAHFLMYLSICDIWHSREIYKTLGCFREDLKYRMEKINLPKHSRLQVQLFQ